jgi:hypothetical protein
MTGPLGFIAINNADTAWTASFSTSLPDGKYCDVISGAPSGGSCSGKTFVLLVTPHEWTVSYLIASPSLGKVLVGRWRHEIHLLSTQVLRLHFLREGRAKLPLAAADGREDCSFLWPC